jgi:CoA:oxalate CoA-transferase
VAEQVLTGMKVLDLTHCIAGPFCTKLLADYGADVIKIEIPGKGDMARRMGPFPQDIPDPEKSGLFLYLNTNKKGVTLNLKTKTGVGILKKLISQSDVLVENFSPGVLPRLGLDYGTLKKINPKLVMTSISSFGQTGPYRDWKATELTLTALSGIMHKTGDPDREPLKYALNVFQYLAGKIAGTVTLAAVIKSDLTGNGKHIDLSILETTIADVNNRIATYGYSGDLGERAVAKNYVDYPFGGFPAQDGYVAIQGIGRGEEWMLRLFEMIGHPELKEDPNFSTRQNREMHMDEFNAMLYSWLVEHTKQEIFDEAARVRYPAGPVYDTAELVNNPQYRELGFFIPLDHPLAGKLEYPGAPFRMSEGGYEIRRPAPLLGQHNAEVYCGLLGIQETDLPLLHIRGVI